MQDFNFLVAGGKTLPEALSSLRLMFHAAYDDIPGCTLHHITVLQDFKPSRLQGQVQISWIVVGHVRSETEMPEMDLQKKVDDYLQKTGTRVVPMAPPARE